MKNEFLFRSALGGKETPDAALVEKVKLQMAEEEVALQRSEEAGSVRRRLAPRAMVAVVLALVLIPTAAFAAWHFLQPSDVANRFEDHALSAAFESDTAININESVTSGDYIFTLLAIVTGKDISDMPYTSESVQDARTYAVIAIQNADGTPRPATQDAEYGQTSFFVSPLVKGVAPWRLNIATMNGWYQETVVDGIQYRLIECDEVAMFAERGVYLAISENTMIPDNTTFLFNEQTGEIKANPDYEGASVVFDLPLNKALANPEKAQQYLDDLDAFWGTSADDITIADDGHENLEEISLKTNEGKATPAASTGKEPVLIQNN